MFTPGVLTAQTQAQAQERGRVPSKPYQYRPRSNALYRPFIKADDVDHNARSPVDVSSPSQPQSPYDLRPNPKNVPVQETSSSAEPHVSNRTASLLEPQEGKAALQRQLEVPGWLRGSHVVDVVSGTFLSAIPDFGSSFDIIAESLALRLHLKLDHSGAKQFSLPNRTSKTFLGTVTLEWQFAEESERHPRVFHVMKNCVHPVILGRQFLRMTGTMSRNVHRVIEKIIKVSSHFRRRVLFVDTPAEEATSRERMLGLINGRPIGGLADTCSDLTIIKRCVAERMGFAISEGDNDKTEVQFVDGSTAFTTGMIHNVEWCFSATYAAEDIHRIDVHVMDDIPCAFILDKWLLWDNRAFIQYEHAIFDILHSSITTENSVCLIKELRRSRFLKAFGTSTNQSTTVVSIQMEDVDVRLEEARTRSLARDRIRAMRSQERAAAQLVEDGRILQWDLANPITPTGSVGTATVATVNTVTPNGSIASVTSINTTIPTTTPNATAASPSGPSSSATTPPITNTSTSLPLAVPSNSGTSNPPTPSPNGTAFSALPTATVTPATVSQSAGPSAVGPNTIKPKKRWRW